MNFNQLTNVAGVKGTRRGGTVDTAQLKNTVAKAAGTTKDAVVKGGSTLMDLAVPANLKMVKRVESDSIKRDMEAVYEVSKNRAVINHNAEVLNRVATALGLEDRAATVQTSTPDEVEQAVARMMKAREKMAQQEKEAAKVEKEKKAEEKKAPATSNGDNVKALSEALIAAVLGGAKNALGKNEKANEEAPVAPEKPVDSAECNTCGTALPSGYQFDDCRKCRRANAAASKESTGVTEESTGVTEDVQEEASPAPKKGRRNVLKKASESTYDYKAQ